MSSGRSSSCGIIIIIIIIIIITIIINWTCIELFSQSGYVYFGMAKSRSDDTFGSRAGSNSLVSHVQTHTP